MQAMSPAVLRDGSEVELRPLEPADRERIKRLFFRLSPESVYRRFLSPIQEPSEVGLDRLLDIDHAGREAVAAVVKDEVVGVARYFRADGATEADIAVLVEDAWQGRGLSLLLVDRLASLARSRGITRFTAIILSQNRPAIAVVRRAFPNASFKLDETEVSASMEIGR